MCVLCMYLKHIILHSDADEGARHTSEKLYTYVNLYNCCNFVQFKYNYNFKAYHFI